MSTTPEILKPWYKHPWLWFVIIIPVVALILSFSMLYVAITQGDSEVTDDWYRKGKAIRQDLHRDNYASALTISADLSQSGKLVKVAVISQYKLDDKALPAALTLDFSHPTDSKKDLNLVLPKQPDGSYQGDAGKLLDGRYYITLSTTEWRLKDMVFFPLERHHTLNPGPVKE